MTLIFVGSVPQGGTMLDPLPMRWERRPHPPPHTGCAPGLVQVRLREAAAGRGLQPRGDRRAPRASLSPPQQRLLYPQVLHRPVGLSPTPGSCWWCRTASAPSLSLASSLNRVKNKGEPCPSTLSIPIWSVGAIPWMGIQDCQGLRAGSSPPGSMGDLVGVPVC